jgi:hypothetical protein
VSTSRPIGLGALEFYSSKASAAGFGAREIALLRRRYRQNQSVPAGNGPSNIFVSGQPAVIKSQLTFPGAGGSLALAPSGCLPADDLRQPEQQGAGWRWRQSHNQSVRPTIRMRRCRRLPVPKCRLAPSAGREVYSVISGGCPCVIVHELGREPVLDGSRPPTAEMLAGNVNNTKQRLLGYVVAP